MILYVLIEFKPRKERFIYCPMIDRTVHHHGGVPENDLIYE